MTNKEKYIISPKNRTISHISPKILKPSDLDDCVDFLQTFEILHLKENKALKAKLLNKELRKYYETMKLYIAKDFQTQEIVGFACANNDVSNSYPLDYVFIKENINIIRILKRMLYFIYLDAGVFIDDVDSKIEMLKHPSVTKEVKKNYNQVYKKINKTMIPFESGAYKHSDIVLKKSK